MKKNLRWIIVLLLIIIFVCTCCLYVYNNKQNDYIESEFKEIHVVLDDNYPPYVVRDDQGNLSGIFVDEWNLWSIKTGIKVKLFATSWDNALKSMNEEKFDVIDTIFENEGRKQIYDFGKAHTDIDVSIIFNNKLSAITDIASLKGFKVAVKKGDNQLLKVVEQGFSKISKSEHTKIYNKWFGFQYVNENYSVYLILGFYIIFTFCGIMIFLNIILKKRVKQKTRQLTEVIEKLIASENRISAIFEANPDMFFILNDKYEFTDYKVNSEGRLIFQPNFFIGKQINEVFNEEISNSVIAAIKMNLETDEMQILEYSYKVDDETKYYEARIVRYLHNQVLSVIRDITDKKQTELKMYEMSIKDSITGLYNRDYFENFIESLEVGSLDSLIVVMCDLDGLKFINDTLGHISGDTYLKKAADLINKVFNSEDSLIARIGGDEFGIILKNRNEETVIKMKEKLMQLLKEENTKNSDNIPLSISVGYSVAVGDKFNIKNMIKEADDYMYRQKLQNKQSTKNDLVKIITKMLETRDFITEGHCDRLQYSGVYLAKKIGLEDKCIQDISLFCKFHDIGKIGISDNILFKPGKLTAEEFEEMKKHTEIGYRIAKASPDIAHLGEYILKHHEWWNGMGYPFGLKGEDIPIQCRILSIVDAYDAMISDRPYRKALSKKEALDEIIRFSGKQFDPKLVDKFCEMINELDMESIDRLELE